MATQILRTPEVTFKEPPVKLSAERIKENDRFAHMMGYASWKDFSEHVDKDRAMFRSERFDEKHDCMSPWKHGVVRNVDWKTEADAICSAIITICGDKSYWTKKNPDGTYDIEWVNSSSVSPRSRYPWDWCGESILFPEYQLGDTWQHASRNDMSADEIERRIKENWHKLGL